ncbi:TPA: hypothetical protein ACHICQ_000845 [Enterobacter roggenkampii]|nr:hypothetical protein [Enterobacter roggenkampii]
MTPTLQHQDQERGNPGEDRPLQQRHTQNQLKADRCADKFSKVSGHGDDFSLNPVEPDRGTRIMVANLLRQVFARRNPQLCGEHLNQHRHQVCPDDHPEQLIAEASPGLNIGRKVTWIDITNGSDERRSH